MQTHQNDLVLPDTAELRERLAERIARVCKCEVEPLLADQAFSTIVEQFDSLVILEILLEIEQLYGIKTDEMLPVDQERGAQEMTSTFPENLTGLVDYIREVVARRPEREAAMRARIQAAQGGRRSPSGADSHVSPDTPRDTAATAGDESARQETRS